jgi:hypothetical protein
MYNTACGLLESFVRVADIVKLLEKVTVTKPGA